MGIGERWKSGVIGDVPSIQVCFSAPSFIPQTVINSAVCKGFVRPSQEGEQVRQGPAPLGGEASAAGYLVYDV